MAANIHPSAVIDAGAALGEDVAVGPFAVIGPNTHIGDRCRIGPHAVIHPFTTLGEACILHANAVLGDLPQDLAFENIESSVTVGDRCVLREGVTVHRGTTEHSTTEIGADSYLMTNSHIGHNCKVGQHVILTPAVVVGGYVEIADQVFIGGGTAIHQFSRIGRLAMIGGLSGISKDVPPFLTTVPVQLNRILGPNTVGLRRAGMTPEERRSITSAFRILYRSGLNTTQALDRLRTQCAGDLVAEMISFIEQSKRGICRNSATGPRDPAAED